MATATTPTPQAAQVEPSSSLRPYHMTVEEYERIANSGALGDRSRVFLWKGQLVEKVSDRTKNRPHITAVNELDSLLSEFLRRAGGFFVEQDQPIRLGDDSVPEPDLKIVRGRNRDYAARTPTVADCPLVIEVADSSVRDDRTEMLQGYAEGGVATYWIVNIPSRCIEVYTGPSGPGYPAGYARCQSFGPDDEVPVVLDGTEVGRVAVRDVLP